MTAEQSTGTLLSRCAADLRLEEKRLRKWAAALLEQGHEMDSEMMYRLADHALAAADFVEPNE